MGRLSDALKALFGSNKTSGTYVPLVTSNGTPDGNVSMSYLASVLGALMSNIGLKVASDANDELGVDGMTTFLQVKNNVANYPRTNPRGFLIVSRINSGYINQAYWDARTCEVYTRSLISSSWSDWELASAQSAQKEMGSLSTDCDTLYDIGVYHVASTGAVATYHTPTNYGTLIVFSPSKENAAYCVQVFVERVNGNFRVFIRTGNRQNGYYAWKILATTTDFSS